MAATSSYSGPLELTLRVGAQDELFIRRLFGLAAAGSPAPHLPARLVVDAHVPLLGSGLAAAARIAGVPFLIDPETYWLHDVQHDAAPWCRVPFAVAAAHSPADLMDPAIQTALVEAVIEYQIEHQASAIIAPYVHIEKPGNAWDRVQAGLWRRTAEYAREHDINLPVIAVVAVGWRCLHPLNGVKALGDLWRELARLNPSEVALAASKVHMGAHPEDRIAELLILVRSLARHYKLTMWQQGLLGEACVIEGAAGYECGVGRREQCDLQSRMTQYRRADDGHPPARPIYLPKLGRSVPKKRLLLARTKRRLWARVVCPFPDCCAPGGDDLLADARRHTVVARARELHELGVTSTPQWRWNRLTQRLADGIALANELNALGASSPSLPGIQMGSMRALYEVANARRTRRRIKRTA